MEATSLVIEARNRNDPAALAKAEAMLAQVKKDRAAHLAK